MVSDPLHLVGAVSPPQELDLTGAPGSGCGERSIVMVIVVVAVVGVVVVGSGRGRIESFGMHKGSVRFDGGLAEAAVVSFHGSHERLMGGAFQRVGVELEFVEAGVQCVPPPPAPLQ